ncbi:gamma-crystallin M3-like [Xiphias gladius]|uniref:gamma-crystallin M3-like n=1 Tax=Xiphias gladius TaxID=8245 RepID=UPI001A99BE02|nr:gamma-crystallin M3-like [Xiphias gladius]
MGNQNLMSRGELGPVVSQPAKRHSGSFGTRLYEHCGMGGEMIELTDACPNRTDPFRVSNFNPCNVMDGPWLLCELSLYYLRTGRYRSFSDWSGNSSRISSIRRLMDL